MTQPNPLAPKEMERLRAIDRDTLWHPFTQMQGHQDEDPPPPIIVGAEGNSLIAADGRRYLDANSGYWCLALGCRPTRVEQAVVRQMSRFSQSTLLGLSHQPAIELAERLTALAGPPLSHAFFASSGSEAVEVALKMAYQYQVHCGHPERSKFLAFADSYHGDTTGCVAVGGIDIFHSTFGPLLFPVVRVDPPFGYHGPWEEADAEFVEKHANVVEDALRQHAGELAGLIIEPLVQGAGGIIPQPPEYLRRIVDAARAYDVKVIFDEVAVGMGRLGRLFAFEEIDRKPDILCLAKGLTAGVLPGSAVLASNDIYQAFKGAFSDLKTFFHGHTFTGSALGCAAALEVLDIFTEDEGAYLKRVREEVIPAFWKTLEPLRNHSLVGEVRGRGLMAGIELVKDKAKNEPFPYKDRTGHLTVLEARRRGVNTRTIADVLLCAPPLTVTSDELNTLGKVYRDSLDEVCRIIKL